VTWELHELVHRYAAHVDDRLPVAPLFTEDGVLVLPDPPDVLDPVHPHVGHAAIAEALGSLRGIPRTFHAIVGEVYDGPRGRIACVAHHVLDAETDLVWHLRYLDNYRLTAEGWRIARRELHLDLIETRHLKRARIT
jgi:hypothetical protein